MGTTMKNLTIRVAEGLIWLSIGDGEEFLLARSQIGYSVPRLKGFLELASGVYAEHGKCELTMGEVDEDDA